MDLKNGLACRYCAKKWFPHALSSHEKNCRTKIVKVIDLLAKQYGIVFDYPPEYQVWSVPPQIPMDFYNQHAQREYSQSWQPCARCGRSYPMIGIADHLTDCSGDGKSVPKKKQKTIQISIGPPNPQAVQQVRLGNGPQKGGDSRYMYEQEEQYDDEVETDATIPSRTLQKQQFKIPEQQQGPDNRIPCMRCGRKFDTNRIAAHEKICQKLKNGPPPEIAHKKTEEEHIQDYQDRLAQGFDIHRYDGMAGEKGVARRSYGSAMVKPSNSSIKTIKPSGKSQITPKGQYTDKQPINNEPRVQQRAIKTAPKDPMSDRMMSDGRIACCRCGRGFARERIEKHEGICKELVNVTFDVPGQQTKRSLVMEQKFGKFASMNKQGFDEYGRPTFKDEQDVYDEYVPSATYQQKGYDLQAQQSKPGIQAKQPTKQMVSSQYGQMQQSLQKQQISQSSAFPKSQIQSSAANAKFCHECGAGYAANAKFCMECGSKRI